MTDNKDKRFGISSAVLHILAMIFMLCDHLWATIISGQQWLTCIGRLAFPIFAFMTVEGYFHTKDLKRYLKRIFLFALIAEIPLNLMVAGGAIYPFHQNVLFTFLIGLIAIRLIEKVKGKYVSGYLSGKFWMYAALITIAAALLATITMVDYYAAGVLTVLLFYFLRGNKWWQYLGQLVGMIYIHGFMLGGLVYPVMIGSTEILIPHQGIAVLALIPIWLYNGKRGHHSKAFQYFCYAFYPAHMLILYLLWLIIP